jgi:hypothetical protein
MQETKSLFFFYIHKKNIIQNSLTFLSLIIRPPSFPYGTKIPFGELLAEYPCGSWVKAVKWSPSGTTAAFVCM